MNTALNTGIAIFAILAAIMQLALLADQSISDSPLTAMGRRIKAVGYLVLAVVAITEIASHTPSSETPMLVGVMAITLAEVFHAANRLFAHYIEETTETPKRHEDVKHRH